MNTVFKTKVLSTLTAAAVVAVSLFAAPAMATVLYSQGFETNTDGWTEGSPYGTISRDAYSSSGLPAYEGDYYANVTETPSSSGQYGPGSGGFGPYTFWGGAETGAVGFTTSIATYFDIGNWQPGDGFEWSVAAQNQSGTHLRDFIFHIYVNADGNAVVGDSNNSNYNPQDRTGNNHVVVSDSGWYILQHEFFNNGGALGVRFNVRDDVGNLLYSDTRSTSVDDFSSIYGGAYYGWFTDVTLDDGLNIDAVSLRVASVPEPGTLGLFGIGLAGLLLAIAARKSAAGKGLGS